MAFSIFSREFDHHTEQVHAAEQLLEQTRRRIYQILADDDAGEQDGQ